MQRSKIEWLRDPITGEAGFSINPIKGLCPVDCKDNQGKSYCYARRLYKRFHWNPEIRMEYSLADDIKGIRKPSRIFIGSTMELFGEWIKPQWLIDIFESVEMFPQHTFIFLTKKPENLIKWSPFPPNCWVGVSATNTLTLDRAVRHLYDVEATVRFVSLEPLLDWKPLFPIEFPSHLNWLIIGQQTPVSAKTAPKIEWVREIVGAGVKADIPIFLKNNLWETLFHSEQVSCDDPFWTKNGRYELRQDLPQ